MFTTTVTKYNIKPKFIATTSSSKKIFCRDDYIEVPGGTDSIIYESPDGDIYEVPVDDLIDYDDDNKIQYSKSKSSNVKTNFKKVNNIRKNIRSTLFNNRVYC